MRVVAARRTVQRWLEIQVVREVWSEDSGAGWREEKEGGGGRGGRRELSTSFSLSLRASWSLVWLILSARRLAPAPTELMKPQALSSSDIVGGGGGEGVFFLRNGELLWLLGKMR